jgi:hypothetical protein
LCRGLVSCAPRSSAMSDPKPFLAGQTIVVEPHNIAPGHSENASNMCSLRLPQCICLTASPTTKLWKRPVGHIEPNRRSRITGICSWLLARMIAYSCNPSIEPQLSPTGHSRSFTDLRWQHNSEHIADFSITGN